MAIRVVAGKYRHRLLTYPDDSKHIRPTKDRIREAIFSALGNIEGYEVLDLYAGSGAMGIEAISRGAKKAVFVDINDLAIKTVKENIHSLNISDCTSIIKLLDKQAIDFFEKEGMQFDLVILDPPYKLGEYKEIVNLLISKKIIKDNGILVLESDHYIDLDWNEFKKDKDYKYGDIIIRIIWR